MDYIDIDPYGSPNPFLDSAIQKLRYGFLAITATDTAPLCGAYENMCKRKYYAKPIHNELMHEFGLRILIRKVQLVAAQYYKALIPLVSYYKDHYFRVFFYSVPTKSIVDDILKEHKTFDYKEFNLIQGNTYGPIYTGKLNNKEILKTMLEESKKHEDISKETSKFLKNLYEEYETLGLYDIHKISKELKITEIKDYENLFKELDKEGYKYSRTIFSKYAIKTNAPISFIKKIIQK
jgi:tRNA (guanine26-N2/guanine27-N2)-dimethyltransferase